MSAYYWAGGRRVPLEPSTDLVVDLDSEAVRGEAADALRAHGRPLSGSLLLVPAAKAEEVLGAVAHTSPGVHPVFRAGDGALVAVLPQVRVEARTAQALDAVSASLHHARVAERTEERLVLEPDSGRGEDALALANEIAEGGAAEVAQARFVRVVARPGPRRR